MNFVLSTTTFTLEILVHQNSWSKVCAWNSGFGFDRLSTENFKPRRSQNLYANSRFITLAVTFPVWMGRMIIENNWLVAKNQFVLWQLNRVVFVGKASEETVKVFSCIYSIRKFCLNEHIVTRTSKCSNSSFILSLEFFIQGEFHGENSTSITWLNYNFLIE